MRFSRRRHGWQAWLLWAVVIGCREGAAPPRSRAVSSPADLLARADELASRHQVAGALALLEANRATIAAAPPESDIGFALREKEARLLLNLARPREAAALLETLSRLRPPGESFRSFLARAYLQQGAAAKAVPLFESLAAETLSDLLVEYGEALAGAERTDDGAAAIAAALIRDPWEEAGYLALGRTLARQGRSQAAEPFLERYRQGEAFRRTEQEVLAFEAAGDKAGALHRRARAEMERGRLFEAMDLDNQALQASPGLGDAYLQLARISIMVARPGDAVKELERLPQNPGVLEVLRLAREEEAAAGTPFAEARDRTRGKPLSAGVPDLLRLAESYERSGKTEEARRLSLFLARLARRDRDAARAVLRLFPASGELFIRLWAVDRLDAADDVRSGPSVELSALGIDPARARTIGR